MAMVELQPITLRHVILSLVLPFLLLAFSSSAQPVSLTSLTNDLPVFGSLPPNATAYYTLTAPATAYQQTVLLSVSAEFGFPSLYVSLSNPTPSPASFDYFASWQTGGVTSLVRPPQAAYTVYMAVKSSPYSRCNYTVLATAYDATELQSTPVLLSEAQPVASAIAAGEYRYFTYTVATNTSAAAISLTETYGQSWLLINSPNATQLLPTIGAAQYSSITADFPLVALTQPAAGNWTIGVWSNFSSAFSIIAAAATDTLSMQLGVSYPGYVSQAAYQYYSIYLDPLLLSSGSGGFLDLELLSLSGDADLFCSDSDPRPSQSSYSWCSEVGGGVDRILIPPDTVRGSTMYCGVFGFALARYIFSVSYGSDSVISLTPGDTRMVEAGQVGFQLFSFVFPATAFVVTLSVVCEVGSTTLYMSPYGNPPNNFFYAIYARDAPVQTQQIYSTVFCGTDNEFVIPGTNPPLCQLQVSLYTANLAVYSITATSTAGQLVELTAGEPAEREVSVDASAYFSITIPDNLSNLTMIITVTNGASGLLLKGGTMGYSGLSTLWMVSQQAGNGILVWQVDWTDPVLMRRDQWAGTYGVVLSATSDPITFSIVYTVANASVYSSTIVRLLDGQPQQGVVASSGYNFYYFEVPAAGWPYVVTISLRWVSGSGQLRMLTSADGPHVGPVAGDATSLYITSGQVPLEPNQYPSCNPSTSACGYSISIRGNSEQALYILTVTTGHWIRTLYTNIVGAASGSVLAAADSDYWRTSVFGERTNADRQLLYALTVTSGAVSVFASNVSSAPNLTTAQLTWPAVSSTSVLAYTVPASSSVVYWTVTCSSPDSTPCEYALEAQVYPDALGSYRVSSLHADPVVLLLSAGRGVIGNHV